jgi:hypothetical protein
MRAIRALHRDPIEALSRVNELFGKSSQSPLFTFTGTNAPEVLVGPDEDVAVRDRQRGAHGFATNGIDSEEIKGRCGFEHENVTVPVRHIETVPSKHW